VSNRPASVSTVHRIAAWRVFLAWLVIASIPVLADEKPAQSESAKGREASDGAPVPLNKEETVLLDKKGKRVLLKTHVVLRQGALELLCCLKQTKEHEAILSLDAKAYVVHTALLALDAKPGTPVRNAPEYQPPKGPKVEIYLNWTDDEGKAHRVAAQSWVREAINRFRVLKMEKLPAGLNLPRNAELRYDEKLKELTWYGPMTAQQRDDFLALSNDKEYRRAIESFFEQSQPKEMQADWVFAGSSIYTDEDSGKKFYLAEDGDLICVANFASATLDVAIQSSASDAERNFEAFTDRIPPKETPVTIELIPVVTPPEKPANRK
jgi:hypothetical protein